jgi:small nuclear ribonucleoprotein (snRNP)-like protein
MALRPLDPSIVNAYQPPKFNMPDPLQDVAALEQIKSGRISRQLHEQQLAQAQRDSTALENMRAAITKAGGPADLDVAADEMIKSGVQHYIDLGYKIKEKQQFQKNFLAAMGGGETPPAQPAPVATTAPIQSPSLSLENLSGGGTGIKMRPILPEQAPAVTNALAPSGLPTNFGENVLGQIAELERKRNGLTMLAAQNPAITPMISEISRQIAELRKPQTFSPGQTVYVPGQAPFTLPPAERAPVGVSRGEILFDSKGRVIAQGLAPEAPAPVKIIDRASGEVKYVTPSQAVGQTPASEFTGVTAKEMQKREADYPTATATLRSFDQQSNAFIKDMEELRNHPGLSQISGILAGRIGGITSEGREAKALYDKIKAKGGFQAIQDLKNQSKTGSALGSTSNEEGRKLDASFAAIDRVQDAPSIQKALDDAVTQLRNSKQILRDKYDLTYEYRAGRPSAAPTLAKPAAASKAPAGVPQDVWSVMTPDERKLWQK